MNKQTQNLICILMLCVTGALGATVDYLTEEPIIPNVFGWVMHETATQGYPTQPIAYRTYSMSSVWFLFELMGIMFFAIELYGKKSNYMIKGYLIMIKYKILLKLNEGAIEYYEYKIKMV